MYLKQNSLRKAKQEIRVTVKNDINVVGLTDKKFFVVVGRSCISWYVSICDTPAPVCLQSCDLSTCCPRGCSAPSSVVSVRTKPAAVSLPVVELNVAFVLLLLVCGRRLVSRVKTRRW